MKEMGFLEFSQLLFNRELLASKGTVEDVLSKYQLAITHGHEFVGLVKNNKSYQTVMGSNVFKGDDGKLLGILPIKGALIYEETGWEALCGMTSYEGLQNKAEYMIKERGIDHLILELNSGGGMAYGCFETAQYVKNLAKENDVKITTYVDGVAHSGGYAWACIADEVILNPMARVGSIGVVLPLVNTSEKDKKEGIERIYITAGKSKVPFDKDGKFTKESLDKIEKDVMVTYDMFVDHVSENRGLDRSVVIDTEASTFNADEALKIGLVDQIMTKENLYQYLGNFNGENKMSLNPKDGSKIDTGNEAGQSKVMEQLSSQITQLEGDKVTLTESVSTLTSERDKAVSDLGIANSTISELQKQIADLNASAAQVELDSRREKISALVSEDDVDFHMEIADGLDAEKFGKYVDNLTKQNEKIADSFKPVGVDTQDGEGEQLSAEEKMVARLKARKEGKAV